MTNEALSERLEQSIEDSLTQLGRGSGITPDARQRMAKMIAHPLVFIVEDEQDAEVSRLQKENERLRTALETLLDGAVFADGAVMRCGICGQRDSDGHAEGLICHEARSLLAELEHTDE